MTIGTGAISWLINLNEKNSLFEPFKNKYYIILHLSYLHFVLFFYVIIFKFINFNKTKIVKLFYLLNILFIFVLFYIAFDWGRFVYMTYNFLLIFTFFLLHHKNDIFIKIDKLTFLNKIPLNTKIIFCIFYISSWSPGLQYFEKTHYFPLIDFFMQNIFYIKKYYLLIM